MTDQAKAIDISPEAVAKSVVRLGSLAERGWIDGDIVDFVSALSAALSEARGKVEEAERERDEAIDAMEIEKLRNADLFFSRDAALSKLAQVKQQRDDYNDDSVRLVHEKMDAIEALHAAESELAKLRAEAEWQPIETMPKGEEIFMAATVDGRIMIFRGSILASMMKCSTPDHLQFPAVAWKPLPSPLKDPAPRKETGSE